MTLRIVAPDETRPAQPKRGSQTTLEERFLQKVLKTDSCWLWQGSIDGSSRGGYGRFRISRNKVDRAHRVAYRLYVGEIPDGLTLDHLCRNRACVNPAHLEAVSNRENILRGVSIVAQVARDTHCPNGHEYTEANTYVWRGQRSCRLCTKTRLAAYYVRRGHALQRQRRANGGSVK